MFRHKFGILKDCAREGARDEGPVRVVRPVRERFGNTPKAGFICKPQDFRTWEAEDRKVRVNRCYGVDDGLGLSRVRHDGVVESAVRLHIPDPGSLRRGQGLQGTNLVHHVVGQFGGADVQEAPSESGEVPVADVGADDDTGSNRVAAGPADDAGIAGVESARNVRARNRAEYRQVIAEAPASEGLADVAVQVNRCHL